MQNLATRQVLVCLWQEIPYASVQVSNHTECLVAYIFQNKGFENTRFENKVKVTFYSYGLRSSSMAMKAQQMEEIKINCITHLLKGPRQKWIIGPYYPFDQTQTHVLQNMHHVSKL